MKENIKRILALALVIFLVAMVFVTLYLAVTGSPYFMGSLYVTLGLPLLIYAFLAWLILRSYTEDFYEQNKSCALSSGKTEKGWAGVRQYLSSIRPERTGTPPEPIICPPWT